MAIYFKYVCIHVAVNTKSSHTFVGVCYYWAQWLAMVCRWQYTSSMYVKLSTQNLLTLLLEYVIIGHNGWLWYVDGNILQVCMLTVNAKSSYTFVGVCYYWAQWLAMVCRWQYTSSMYV